MSSLNSVYPIIDALFKYICQYIPYYDFESRFILIFLYNQNLYKLKHIICNILF